MDTLAKVPNNTHSSWYKDPGLRKNFLVRCEISLPIAPFPPFHPFSLALSDWAYSPTRSITPRAPQRRRGASA